MMSNVTWDRVEPAEPCVSPDGHDFLDVNTMGSHVPERVVCPRCHRDWQIVVFDETTRP